VLASTVQARSLRNAHVALAAAFVAFGTVDGAWVARLPAIKHRLGLDSGQLGLAILGVSLAATVLLTASGWLSSRFGSRGPIFAGLLVVAGGLTATAFAPSFAALLPSACLIGAGFSIVDVAANAHGVALEERLGRPILSALHGAWSLGLLVGSGIAAGAAAAEIGVRTQFPAVSIGVVAAAFLVTPRLLPSRADAAVDTAHFAWPGGVLALPAFLTFCSMFVESSTMNWSAVFLSGPAHTSAAVAAGGVVAYSVAMVAARLAGDPLLVRWGVSGLARRGGGLVVAGMVLALVARSAVPGLVGFALVGAGCAALVPALFRVAAATPGISSSAGIASVATAGYIGGVVNGPAIGFLARGVGLTLSLSLIAVAGAAIAILGPRLDSRA
jgi:MFS family permease